MIYKKYSKCPPRESIRGTRTDTFDHGLSHPFKRPGADANGLTRNKNALVWFLFVLYGS